MIDAKKKLEKETSFRKPYFSLLEKKFLSNFFSKTSILKSGKLQKKEECIPTNQMATKTSTKHTIGNELQLQ